MQSPQRLVSLDHQALLSAVGIGAAVMAILGVMAGIPACTVLCCITPLGFFGTGASYTFFGMRRRRVPTTQSAALGGGIAGGFAGAVFSIVWGISYAIFLTPETATTIIQQYESYGIDLTPEMAASVLQGPSLTTMLACSMIAVANGAIFGAIGAALIASRARHTPPPSEFTPLR